MTEIVATFDDWSIGYHKTMAAVASLGQALKQQASIQALPAKFRSAANNFKSVLALLNELSESQIPQDDLRKFIHQMESLYTTVDGVLSLVTRLGYTNRTEFAATFSKIRKLNNDLQDFIETWRLSLDPSLSSEIAAGVDEYRRGETVSLDSLLRN